MVKLYSIFAVLLALTAFVTAKDPGIFWMQQKLDHFNSSDTRILLMRFLGNNEFFQFGGPLFIYVGGKEPFLPSNIGKGTQIYRMAEENHGYLFHTEYRFYGESGPLDNMTNEHLKYLDTKQALADLNGFIQIVKRMHGMASSRIILVGCCSGGALATWFKQLYPDLVNGVWASSAMLHAKTDLTQINVLAGQIITYVGGFPCYNRIKGGIAELEELIDNKRGDDIREMFKLCGSFNESNSLDVSTLLFEISEIFINLITYHKVDEIRKECTKLVEGSVSDLLGISYYVAGKLGDNECNELTYNSNLIHLKNPSFYRNILRQWTYQSCNEFGGFKASNSSSQIFGTRLPLDYFVTLCADTFGEKFTREYIESRIEETNERFGGRKPDVENVYWTNGELDPYRLLSIQGERRHATLIPNLTHCGDLHEITPEDSPELKASKEKLEWFVGRWLTL